jgi:oligopeptide/dipeptide ABC transporter ATP-binding protein
MKHQRQELITGMTDGDAPLLEVDGLSVHFGAVRAADNVSFSLHPGETLGLVGESGSGKSTVGRGILQLVRPTAGSVRFEGRELTTLDARSLRSARRDMQLIFQDPKGSLDPKMKIVDIVAEPLKIHRLLPRRDQRPRAVELLRLTGLGETILDRYPHQLSGGQAQRVAIARALALEPKFLVADEPISSLDVSVQAQIVNLLSDLSKRLNLSLLFIAHDLAIERNISDRVAVMYLGRIVEIAEKTELYARPLHPYTQALLSAVPVPDPVREKRRKRIVLEGEIPLADMHLAGCALSARCPLRTRLGNPEKCLHARPELRPVAPQHRVACHYADTREAQAAREAAPSSTTTQGEP